MFTVGSLFSGIGGIELGLERTGGFRTVWQVEKDEYARRVLAKHWPHVARFSDVRYFLGGKRWRRCRAAFYVDLVCGGFPCEDISDAGKREGIGGKQSGLWTEFARIIRLIRPRFILVENVAALLGRGLGRVLGDLAACGYDAEWRVLAASDFGAPHVRERVFVIGYARGKSGEGGPAKRQQGETGFATRPIADSYHEAGVASARVHAQRTLGNDAAGCLVEHIGRRFGAWAGWAMPASTLCRMDDGVPGRLDRLTVLGRSVVPQVAEWIGRRILEGCAC